MLKRAIYSCYSLILYRTRNTLQCNIVRFRRRWNNRHNKTKCPLRWGIIGTGGMAKVFGDALNKSRNDIAFAVLSRSEERGKDFSRDYDVKYVYTDLQEFLKNPDIDVVYVATPLETHYYYTRVSLEMGKNVLCEKPLVQRMEEAYELERISKEQGLLLMEGMWSRLLPTYQQAKDWIKEGKIGEIESIKVEKSRRKNYKNLEKRKSILWDYGVYPISFVQYFLKNIKVDYFYKNKISDLLDNDWHILMKKGTKRACIAISGLYAGESKGYIIGKEGSIEFQGHFNRSNVVTLYDKSGKQIERKVFDYKSEGFEYEIAEVNRLIRNGGGENKDLAVNMEDTIYCIEIMSSLESVHK